MLSSKEIAWAAGFLEGDGCFVKQHGHRAPYVTVAQKQKEPLERLQRYFGGTIRHRKAGQKREHWVWNLNGYAGVGLMMTLYTLMSPNRKVTIAEALEEWESRPNHPSNRQTCPYGHPYDETNTYRHSWGRGCRTCRSAYAKTEKVRQAQKLYYEKNKERIIARISARRKAKRPTSGEVYALVE